MQTPYFSRELETLPLKGFKSQPLLSICLIFSRSKRTVFKQHAYLKTNYYQKNVCFAQNPIYSCKKYTTSKQQDMSIFPKEIEHPSNAISNRFTHLISCQETLRKQMIFSIMSSQLHLHTGILDSLTTKTKGSQRK